MKLDQKIMIFHKKKNFSVHWNASVQANGIYIAVMEAGGITKTEKMMLMK